MPTRKLAELPRAKRCRHPDHLPASMVVRPPGLYEHVCPACGRRITFSIWPEGELFLRKTPSWDHP